MWKGIKFFLNSGYLSRLKCTAVAKITINKEKITASENLILEVDNPLFLVFDSQNKLILQRISIAELEGLVLSPYSKNLTNKVYFSIFFSF
jgi:bifunctional ADP-heptose synthase (sugar kinase/adenylyltransferase)